MLLACFRAVVLAASVYTYCVAHVVYYHIRDLLIALAIYRTCRCTEGLHFSAFNFYSSLPWRWFISCLDGMESLLANLI